ncbi:MAG: hypothetical protein ACKO1U_10100 [Bacteroidota bacterium]
MKRIIFLLFLSLVTSSAIAQGSSYAGNGSVFPWVNLLALSIALIIVLLSLYALSRAVESLADRVKERLDS